MRGRSGAAAMAAVAALLCAAAARGGEAPEVTISARGTEPCLFFRLERHGRGLHHFATEMHWACEAIARRKEAGLALPDALRAAERALEDYRRALVAHRPRMGADGDAARREMARATGALTALEALGNRY